MSDIPSKFDELSLASLIEEGSSSSLLESTAEEIKEFSTANKNGTDLDDIIDILDLYLTSTGNDTDTATVTVSDEQKLQVSHSVFTVNDFTLTFDTIPQNIKFFSTIQHLEGGVYQASLNVPVKEEIDVLDHISITPVLLLKHYLPVLLELGIMLFKFKIVLLVFIFGVSDLFSKLSAITLTYLELLNSQQYALFYAACPPTFIYKKLY